MKAYKDIPTYIKAYPKPVQAQLRKMRAAAKKAAPKATEAIKYGLPTLILNGNLVHFGAFKDHIGFYPGPGAIRAFKKDLAKYEGSKGTIKFPIDKPLPLGLVARIVKARAKENTSKKR